MLNARSWKLDTGEGLFGRGLPAVGICLHRAGLRWLDPGSAIDLVVAELRR